MGIQILKPNYKSALLTSSGSLSTNVSFMLMSLVFFWGGCSCEGRVACDRLLDLVREALELLLVVFCILLYLRHASPEVLIGVVDVLVEVCTPRLDTMFSSAC